MVQWSRQQLSPASVSISVPLLLLDLQHPVNPVTTSSLATVLPTDLLPKALLLSMCPESQRFAAAAFLAPVFAVCTQWQSVAASSMTDESC